MKVTIMYGSATGNAEQIAKRLASTVYDDNAPHHPFLSAEAMEMNRFKRKMLFKEWALPPPEEEGVGGRSGGKHALAVMCSTTGNRNAPENVSWFFRFLKRPPPPPPPPLPPSLASKSASALAPPPLPLLHVAYAVLALGDMNYDRFCKAGRVADGRLGDWGGARAAALVCVNEAAELKDAVEP